MLTHTAVIFLLFGFFVIILNYKGQVAGQNTTSGATTIGENQSSIENGVTQASTTVPEGCICAETNVPNSRCVRFECNCQCDLTASKCDTACCCDSQCPSDLILIWKSSGKCKNSQSSNQINNCIDSYEELYQINPKYQMWKDVTGAEEMLCVWRDNNPSKGNFFVEPVSSSVDSDSEWINPYSQSAKDDKVDDLNQYYLPGDTIPVVIQVNSAQSMSSGFQAMQFGKLIAPLADSFGRCGVANFVGFMEDSYTTCNSRLVPAHNRSLCSSLATEILSSLVSRTPKDAQLNQFQYNVPPTNLVAIEFDAAAITVDGASDSGESLQWLQKEIDKIYISAGLLSNNESDSATDTSIFNDTKLNICPCPEYAFDSLDLTIEVDNAIISNIKARANLKKIDPACQLDEEIQQTFSFRFVIGNNLTVNTSAALVERSGNPGYVLGKPILAGTRSDNSANIDLEDKGLHLFSFPQNSSSIAGYCLDASVAVQYGKNTMASCVVHWNLFEFMKACAENTVAPAFPPSTYVGKFGNSDPSIKDQWVLLSSGEEANPYDPSFSIPARTCRNMKVTAHLLFATAQIGEVQNPQATIRSASVIYETKDMTFLNADPFLPQAFVFSYTVSFQALLQEDVEYVPPGPPILPKLPWDLFYPFVIAPASRNLLSLYWILVLIFIRSIRA